MVASSRRISSSRLPITAVSVEPCRGRLDGAVHRSQQLHTPDLRFHTFTVVLPQSGVRVALIGVTSGRTSSLRGREDAGFLARMSAYAMRRRRRNDHWRITMDLRLALFERIARDSVLRRL